MAGSPVTSDRLGPADTKSLEWKIDKKRLNSEFSIGLDVEHKGFTISPT